MPPGELLKRRDVVGVRQKAYVENQVGIVRHAVAETERVDVDTDLRLGGAAGEPIGSAARGALLSLAYCIGLGLPFLVIGLAMERGLEAMAWARRWSIIAWSMLRWSVASKPIRAGAIWSMTASTAFWTPLPR